MPVFRWYYFLFSLPLYMLAILPMRVLFVLSDIMRFFVYHAFAYRKQIVFTNLRNSFPDKSEAWINKTAFEYYRNLLDVTLETIKMATASKLFLNKRIQLFGLDLVHDLNKNKQPFILVCGHSGNWEWAGQALQLNSVQVDGLYHPLSSKWFNWFLYKARARFGLYPVPMQTSLREMVQRKHIPSAITFIADQTSGPENCHWTRFLNQDTPFFLGAEKVAKKFNYPVVFAEAYRTKRGHYAVYFSMLCAEPIKTKDFEITELFAAALEKQILKQPDAWLWSHRRWKHKRPNL